MNEEGHSEVPKEPVPTVRVVSVGALVVDFIVWSPRRPEQGETVLGYRYERHPGGKGLNQAVVARRLGAATSMIGAVGDDDFGALLAKSLVREGCETSGLVTVAGEPTGAGFPSVTDDGEVAIVMVPAANNRLTPEAIDKAASLIEQAEVLLIQGEVPLEASARAAEIAAAAGVRVVLNPAPARDGVERLLANTSAVVPNQAELMELTGIRALASMTDLVGAARRLLASGPDVALLTLGSRGAVAVGPDRSWGIDAHQVSVVDPTGAGDAFCGAAGVALGLGMDLPDVLAFANAAGAAAVQVAGAEPSMPRRELVQELVGGVAAPRPYVIEGP